MVKAIYLIEYIWGSSTYIISQIPAYVFKSNCYSRVFTHRFNLSRGAKDYINTLRGARSSVDSLKPAVHNYQAEDF